MVKHKENTADSNAVIPRMEIGTLMEQNMSEPNSVD